MAKMTLEQKEEIKALAVKYEITLEERHLLTFGIFLWKGFSELLLEKYPKEGGYTIVIINNKLSLAEYILLLSKALENKKGIEVSTTIKGIKEKVHLRTNEFIYLFWLQANTLLEEIQDGLYQYKFNWEFRENMNEEGYEHFTKPYTKEELEMILNYERQEVEKRKKSQTKGLKRNINALRKTFREDGIFDKKAKELTSKEYQFLYDSLSVLGFYPKENMEIFSGIDKKEALRDYIRIK